MKPETSDVLFGAFMGGMIGFAAAGVLFTAFPGKELKTAMTEINERKQALARDIGSECTIEPAGRDCREVCNLMATEDLRWACNIGMSGGYVYVAIVGEGE